MPASVSATASFTIFFTFFFAFAWGAFLGGIGGEGVRSFETSIFLRLMDAQKLFAQKESKELYLVR